MAVDRTGTGGRFFSVLGSGLGLAIVKASAERHRARVTLGEREQDTGLVVRVTFPRG
jgi:signal transduction histidine kinase